MNKKVVNMYLRLGGCGSLRFGSFKSGFGKVIIIWMFFLGTILLPPASTEAAKAARQILRNIII